MAGRDGVTIRQAAEKWVSEMNAYPQEMINKLMQADIDDWTEVTTPSIGDRVWVYEENESGTIEKVRQTPDDEEDDEVLYEVELDSGKTVFAKADDMEVERDTYLPMWGTMWSFGDSADDWWLEEGSGIEIMSECGFRVYESYDFGFIFGIDGAGYDFYESHWIPLYKARGLQWHDPVAEQEYQMEIKGYRKGMLGSRMYWMNDNGDVVEEVIE